MGEDGTIYKPVVTVDGQKTAQASAGNAPISASIAEKAKKSIDGITVAE